MNTSPNNEVETSVAGETARGIPEAKQLEETRDRSATRKPPHAPTNPHDCNIPLHQEMAGYYGLSKRLWWVAGIAGLVIGVAFMFGLDRSRTSAITTTIGSQELPSPDPSLTPFNYRADRDYSVPIDTVHAPLHRNGSVHTVASGRAYGATVPSATQLGQNLQLGAGTYGEYTASNVNPATGVPNPYPATTPVSYTRSSSFRAPSQPPGSVFGSSSQSPLVVTETTDAVGSSGGSSPRSVSEDSTTDARTYAILPATKISAELETEIISDVPGTVVADVTADVKDSTGEHVLIPASQPTSRPPLFSRIIGQYTTPTQGQRRLGVTWTTLVLPNGKQIDLGNATTSDTAGGAGLPAQVDAHSGRVFGTTLLLGALASVAQLAQGHVISPIGTQSVASTIASAQAGQFVATGTQMIQGDRELPPSLTIAAKTPFTIIVDHTVYLPQFGNEQEPW